VAGDWSGEVLIRGNARLSTEEIAAAARSVACVDPDSLCVAAVCRAVAEAYWGQGYLDAEIKCERAAADGDTIRVDVVEGEPTSLASVTLEGADPEDVPELRAILAAGDLPLSQQAIEAGIDRVLAFYDARGRPLATARPEVRRLDPGRLEIVLKVSPGARATLGGVVFRGLKRMRASAVLPETGLRPGEPYDGAEVDRARERLLALRVFESVSDPDLILGSVDTTVSVGFDVTEARAGSLEGALAYSPGAGDKKVAGSINLEMLSIGGTLRRASVLWRRSGDDRLVWSLSYREPRLAGRPFALDAALASDVVDTSFARRRLTLGLVYVGQPHLEVGVGGSLGSTRDRALAGGEGDFSERGLTFRLRREGRNRPINPESGFFMEITEEVEVLSYSEGPSLDRTLTAVGARAQYLLGLTARTKLAPGGFFAGVFSTSGEVPVSHLVRLGGGGGLRGYPEEWFTAQQALVLTCEVRRLLGPDSRVYAFFDAATLDAETHSFGDLSEAPFGYGVGFVVGTTAGLLRLEIALGRGDDWSQAKLHLAVTEQF
jgi:translocation and assembly module TamA